MKRIAVLASGGGTNFQAVLDGCARGEIDGRVVLLIHNRKDAYARRRAELAGVPACYINRGQYASDGGFEQALDDALAESRADVVVLAGFLSKLGEGTVRRFRHRIVNTHPSLIPSFCGQGYYGRRVHEAVLEYGAKVSGCTIHLVDEHYDTGPVLLQEAVPVLPGDDADALAARILPVEHRLLTRAVALICAGRVRVEGRKTMIVNEPERV